MKFIYLIIAALGFTFLGWVGWLIPTQRSLPIITAPWPLRSRAPQTSSPPVQQLHIYTVGSPKNHQEHLLPQDFDTPLINPLPTSSLPPAKKLPKLDDLLGDHHL